MSEENAVVPVGVEVLEPVTRQDFVLSQIEVLKKDIENTFLTLGRYLEEVRRQGYHTKLGYNDFTAWVKATFEFGWRQAYDLAKIARKAKKWEIADEVLCKHKSSSLKMIMGMRDKDEALRLLEGGPYKVDELRSMVRGRRNDSEESEQTQWRSWSVVLTTDQLSIVNQALELAAKMTNFKEKNALLEIICAEFLSSVIEDPIEAETDPEEA